MIDEIQRIGLYKQINPNELSIEQFRKLEHEIRHPKLNTISDEYFDFKLWYSGFISRQEQFANYISKKLSKNKGAKIFEIGCGRTARLSRFLSEKGFVMTCIDPKIELTSNNSNISFIRSQFNYKKFDISQYDYVVAQEPCEATEHVVRACIEQKVPFMMSLCGVPHRLISGKTPKDVNEWYDYLVNISSNDIKLRYIELNPFLLTPILRSNKF